MKFKELQDWCKTILALDANKIEGYIPTSFTTESGGAPSIRAELKESLDPHVLHVAEDYAYKTTANGSAYSGEVVVMCKKLGKDLKGDDMYTTPNGVVFAYHYYAGSPYDFDSGCIKPPVLKSK